MNGNEVLRIVDAIHRDKNIDKEIVFEGIEQAILSAAKKHYGEEVPLEVQIDRANGSPTVLKEGSAIDSDLLGEILGRISAQTAKQVMIQKIREAERRIHYSTYLSMRPDRDGGGGPFQKGTATVPISTRSSILPRSEQIPGEAYRVGERCGRSCSKCAGRHARQVFYRERTISCGVCSSWGSRNCRAHHRHPLAGP